MRVIPACDIDRHGLHRSNLWGLRAVLADLAPRAEVCLVDGFRLGPLAPAHSAVVDGDTRSAAIAAASIVAKVTRDRIMRRLDALYPRYGFSRHVGYITPVHSAAVRAHGPCDQHRLLVRGQVLRARAGARRGVNRASGGRSGTTACAATGSSATNVRAGRNELDLIVRRGRDLTFVEVKQRRGSGFGGALGAVDAEKRRRVRPRRGCGCRGTRSRRASGSGSRWSRSTRDG